MGFNFVICGQCEINKAKDYAFTFFFLLGRHPGLINGKMIRQKTPTPFVVITLYQQQHDSHNTTFDVGHSLLI